MGQQVSTAGKSGRARKDKKPPELAKPDKDDWSIKVELRINLYVLPTEIRILIFKECMLQWRDYRSTPALIKALRGDPKLYQEALEVFYSIRTCSISLNNREEVMNMPPSVINRVVSLRLWYGTQIEDTQWRWCVRSCIPVGVLSMSNIRSLYLATNSPGLSTHRDRASSTTDLSQLADIVRKCVLVLPCLSKLTLEIPREASRHRRVANKPVQCLEIPIRPTNDALGLMHRWIICDRRPIRNVAVLWDAGRHGTLTWTDHKYWKSVPLANMDLFVNTALPSTRSIVRWANRLSFVGLNPRIISARSPDQDSRYLVLSRLEGHGLVGGTMHEELSFAVQQGAEMSEEEKEEKAELYCIPKEYSYVPPPHAPTPRQIRRAI